jgi:predicted transcriptional regulator
MTEIGGDTVKKTGRPLKSSTRLSHDIKVRLDDESFARLCTYCEQTGKERASVIRLALEQYLPEVEPGPKQDGTDHKAD